MRKCLFFQWFGRAWAEDMLIFCASGRAWGGKDGGQQYANFDFISAGCARRCWLLVAAVGCSWLLLAARVR